MQPEVTGPRGSQLIDSLKAYLNDKNRQQPIIGLTSIIECVKVGVGRQEPLYLCEVCVSQLRRADIRNHILGTHHRFNFIKTHYPHLVAKWEKKQELSERAWDLMAVAKNLESKEGTGAVQLIEVEDDMFQWMETQDEADVGALIKYLRKRQTETTSFPSSLHYPVKAERIVLLTPNQQKLHEKMLQTDITSGDISASTEEPSQNGAPSISQDLPPDNCLTAETDAGRSSHSPPVLSADRPSFLDDFIETLPLHGLSRVVECQTQDGALCCFLCHCCRIRANKEDIISHLISSSHLLNYLMEVYPEQMDVDFGLHPHILQSLVEKLQRDEGRGALKVVIVPESLCGLLACRGYHWCLKTLSKVLTNSKTHKRTTSPKAPARSHKYPSKPYKRKKKGRRRRSTQDTVFNVSLPLTEGVLLLERTSFSTDSPPLTSKPPASNEDEDFKKMDCDHESFGSDDDNQPWLNETSEPHQHIYDVRTEADPYPSEERLLVNLTQNLETGGTEVPYLKQHGDSSVLHEQEMYEEGEYNSRYASQTPTSKDYYENWQNEDYYQTQDRSLIPSVSHNRSMAMPTSNYRHGDLSTEQQFRLSETSAAMWQREDSHYSVNTNAIQNNYNQYHQNQNVLDDSMGNGQWGHVHTPNKPFPFLNSAKQNMTPCVEYHPASSGQVSADHRTLIHFRTNHGHSQPYTKLSMDQVPPSPQSNWIQLIYQDSQADHSIRHYSDYDDVDQQQPHLYSSGSTTQSQNFTQSWWSCGSTESRSYNDSGPNQLGVGNPSVVGQNPSFTPQYARHCTSLSYAS